MYKIENNTQSPSFISYNSSNFQINGLRNESLFKKDYNSYMNYYLIYPLKKDSDYIPITSLSNVDLNISSKKQKLKNEFLYSINKHTGISDVEDIEDIYNIDDSVDTIMNKVIENTINEDFNIIIPVNIGKDRSDSSIRIFDTINIILHSKPNKLYNYDSNRITSGLFYYSYDNEIILLMVIKKEYIKQFKLNIINGKIDPKHVEIWVDKGMIQGNDRKRLHKIIREDMMMKLFMNGFVIREKENIIDELVYRPDIKFKTMQELNTFRNNLNKFLLQ